MSDSVEPISPSAARAAREVRVVFSRLRRRLREIGGAHDLTPSQTAVLSRLLKDGAASASALAAAERVRPQSMAATIAVLEERGLIRRDPDPEDGRRQLVTPSDAGREWVEGSRQAREEWLSRALQDHCTEEERETVLKAFAVLDRLVE
ncbi:MarR family winged helix-turn-helix transcriptional regulator [Actinomadura nitritigenes]|jgi:DNA-binding MarR family transcriptional regulator|uniref:MarR family winged helix-turn-helix transcriptional regulator n=1 Tax=Actinomadura TaxID=1988 RepID=UPI001684202D|nr:MarR family transcriptional regulator [Actinomadura sp. RB99]MBD2895391.1 putative HTH-type transcriptional regulator [Actinomadura sp. RB99]